MSAEVARGLALAEDRLRAHGLTGGQAFDALLGAVRGRLGEPVDVLPAAAEAVRDLRLDGDVDLLGLAYERFFPDLFKGRRGQFFTPRPLVSLALSRLDVRGLTVLDPTCGSGGFLVCAARAGATVRGIERDPLLASLAAVNLRLAGASGDVRRADFFSAEPDPVDVVLANPPFSVDVADPRVLERYALGRGRERAASDWLFVEALARWVRPGGRAAVVMPWSLLVNPSTAPLRRILDADWVREAVCGLPEGVFRPFGGAAGRACLLWLRRRPCPEAPTRWATLSDPGYDVRSQHLRPTSDAERVRLESGKGWDTLPPGAWIPETAALSSPSRPLSSLAQVDDGRCVPSRDPGTPYGVVDLADADRSTGEIRQVRVAPGADVKGQKVRVREGDVLVARLRPSLGNVAVARRPDGFDGPLVGSTEWIPLRAERWPHFVLTALRTASWRRQLPATEGQTRPRTSPGAVLRTQVAWPGEPAVARIDRLVREAHEVRDRMRRRLEAVEQALDRYGAGELDDETLACILDDLETP